MEFLEVPYYLTVGKSRFEGLIPLLLTKDKQLISRLFQLILHGRTVLVIHIPVSGKGIRFLLTLGVGLQLIQLGSNMAVLLAVICAVHLPFQNLRVEL